MRPEPCLGRSSRRTRSPSARSASPNSVGAAAAADRLGECSRINRGAELVFDLLDILSIEIVFDLSGQHQIDRLGFGRLRIEGGIVDARHAEDDALRGLRAFGSAAGSAGGAKHRLDEIGGKAFRAAALYAGRRL